MSALQQTIGTNELTLDADNDHLRNLVPQLPVPGLQNSCKPSFSSLSRSGQDEEDGTGLSGSARLGVPSVLETTGKLYSTPLPISSMIVLSIVRT